MEIITSRIFQNYPEIIFGLSTKSGAETISPFGFNLSLTVGDDPDLVLANREIFFNELGLTSGNVAFQKQVHSEIVTIVDNAGMIGESDAMITSRIGIGLAVSTADCVPVFVYDRINRVIAGIHSGWRGTQKKIVLKTLECMRNRFNSNPADLVIFVGPSISQKNYEVGSEVALLFDRKYWLIQVPEYILMFCRPILI